MKFIFRSLFLKMFLSFWATALVTGIALVVTFVAGPDSVPSLWSTTLSESARYLGQGVVEMADGGKLAKIPAGSAIMLHSCLFDSTGNPITGSACTSLRDLPANTNPATASSFDVRHGLARVAVRMESSRGVRYIFATELPAGPRAAFGITRGRFALQWGMALFVSGFVCFLLSRYLTNPILHLRNASRELAAGKLDVRAPVDARSRTDEIGGLVHDFNAMADRIEELISYQRQLLSDISHELRSPLARLTIALDLARERNGNNATFNHMEQDLTNMNYMIGRLLTVAALDVRSGTLEKEHFSLTRLLQQIAEDARFESQQRAVSVNVQTKDDVTLFGNSKLLHSAIENVVRNALHYTAPGTNVEVSLRCCEVESVCFLLVKDQGPGVPESNLADIFKPLFRVAGARDRVSGGMGLGLAITDRVVRLHGGTITARNIGPGGLEIEIMLPSEVPAHHG